MEHFGSMYPECPAQDLRCNNAHCEDCPPWVSGNDRYFTFPIV